MVLQTASCKAEDEYRTKNYLQIAPLTERRRDQEGWAYERANTVYCPPGTLITAYRLSYTSRNHYLENIQASCSALHTNNHNNQHRSNNKAGFWRLLDFERSGSEPAQQGSYRQLAGRRVNRL